MVLLELSAAIERYNVGENDERKFEIGVQASELFKSFEVIRDEAKGKPCDELHVTQIAYEVSKNYVILFECQFNV